jgi:hypothetical protein
MDFASTPARGQGIERGSVVGVYIEGHALKVAREAMTNQRLTVWQKVTAEFSGHPLSGSYAIADGMVKVKTLHGEKVSQIGALNPEWLARRLLQELAAEGKAEIPT